MFACLLEIDFFTFLILSAYIIKSQKKKNQHTLMKITILDETEIYNKSNMYKNRSHLNFTTNYNSCLEFFPLH